MAVEDPLALLLSRGGEAYGERVTQLEHALQAAALAEAEGAPPALVLAALLHDVGHLVAPDDPARRVTEDLRHEDIGARLLARWYGPEVTEPVRLHVAAKRVLARDAAYAAALSPASQDSLRLQGGPMTDAEAEAFSASSFSQDALRLRRWDDEAKVVDADVPGLERYRDLARELRR